VLVCSFDVELLLERNMAVLGPHIGVVLEEYDVIMPHRKQLLYHLPGIETKKRRVGKVKNNLQRWLLTCASLSRCDDSSCLISPR